MSLGSIENFRLRHDSHFSNAENDEVANYYDLIRLKLSGAPLSGPKKIKVYKILNPSKIYAKGIMGAMRLLDNSKTQEEGKRQMINLANEGSNSAKIECGLNYWNGLRGFEKNKALALEYFKQAADGATADEKKCNDLAYASYIVEADGPYENGQPYLQPYLDMEDDQAIGVKLQFLLRDKKNHEAISLLEKMITRGNKDLSTLLGFLYLSTQDPELMNKSLSLLKTNEKSAEVKYAIGVCHEMGLGTKKNINIAFQYFQQAAREGSSRAQIVLGDAYFHQKYGEKNLEQSYAYFLKAYKQGDFPVELNSKLLYLSFLFNKKDLSDEKCFELAEIQANLDDGFCHYLLGYFYEHGCGCLKDEEKAIQYYESASKLGERRGNAKLAYFKMIKGDQGGASKQFNIAKMDLYIGKIDADVCFSLGLYFNLKGEANAAKAYFVKGKELGSVESEAQLCLAQLIKINKSKIKAHSDFKKLKKLAENNSYAKEQFERLLKGTASITLDNPKQATKANKKGDHLKISEPPASREKPKLESVVVNPAVSSTREVAPIITAKKMMNCLLQPTPRRT